MNTIGGAILKLLAAGFNLSNRQLLCIAPLIWGLFGTLVVVAIKWTWGFVVPKLLPGAVAQGLVVNEMPWSVAIVLLILIVFFKMVFDGGASRGTDI
jgi:hypothetical protein